MKILEGFGIRLQPLEFEDLEKVRAWRNAEHVRANFEYQKIISPAEQADWFRQLDPACNFYWVIWTAQESIGIVHAKDIDWKARTAEAGIFIGEESFLNGPEPISAIFILMDFLFGEMKMEYLEAKIKAGAQATIRMNAQLGYVLLPGQTGQAFQRYRCTRDAYFNSIRGRFPIS